MSSGPAEAAPPAVPPRPPAPPRPASRPPPAAQTGPAPGVKAGLSAPAAASPAPSAKAVAPSVAPAGSPKAAGRAALAVSAWRRVLSTRIPPRLGLAIGALFVFGIGVLLIRTRLLGGPETEADTLRPSRVVGLREQEQNLIRKAREPMAGVSLEQTLSQLLIGMQRMPVSVALTRAYFDLAAQADREHDILEDYVRERMALAEAFISAQQYESAYDVLELILFVDPDNVEALAKAEDILQFLSRKRRDELAALEAKRPPPPRTAAPPPPAVQPLPRPAEPVNLAISFRTLIAEGKVTVYADSSPIWQKSFDFDNRKLFKRKYLKGERGFDEAYSLSSGTVELRVTVEVDTKDGPRSLEGNLVRSVLSPGAQPTLKIEVSEDATIKTTWVP